MANAPGRLSGPSSQAVPVSPIWNRYPLKVGEACRRRASEHAEQRQEIDRAGQDQPRPSALCREAEQERGRDQRQQKPERVDAAVEFEFPIGVVGLPARETHVRLNALCPGSSSTFGLGRSQAIQTDLLRKLTEGSRASRHRCCRAQVAGPVSVYAASGTTG